MPALCQAAPVRRVHRSLPIFQIHAEDRTVFYTPGDVCVIPPTMGDDVEAALNGERPAGRSAAEALARTLERRGHAAAQAWWELADRPFEPECLTLYLSNRCNLACSYCFSLPSHEVAARNRRHVYPGVETGFPRLDPAIVSAAAQLVARNCARKSKRLTLVVHGGGEPTLHWALLQRVRAEVEQAAIDHGLLTSSYIATHGVMTEDHARWLGQHFSLIGLSCDGPPDVQNVNRPIGTGGPTAAIVERTARVLAGMGATYTIRATIVPATCRRQAEIVAYACDQLGAKTVRFEPAYDAKRTSGPSFRPEDAEEFVQGFLEASLVARERACDLRISGVRLDEIHGPYCNPLREVLQLRPDGEAAGCFLETGSSGDQGAAMSLGRLDASTGKFVLDLQGAAAFRRRAAEIPARCETCVNVYHCARDCPDVCLLTDPVDTTAEGFRCRVQKLLGLLWLSGLAARQPVMEDTEHSVVTLGSL